VTKGVSYLNRVSYLRTTLITINRKRILLVGNRILSSNQKSPIGPSLSQSRGFGMVELKRDLRNCRA